jgi:hypothetical protein
MRLGNLSTSIVLSAICLFAWLAPSSTAFACECVHDLTPEQSLARADLVFEGRLVRSTRSGEHTIHEVRVVRAWKGATVGSTVMVRGSDSSCDLVGHTWPRGRIVFAARERTQGDATVEHCLAPSVRLSRAALAARLDAAVRAPSPPGN